MDPMTFDLPCGEALGGRRLTSTGLRLDGTSDDAVHADYSEHTDGKPVHPMMSLTYRLEPALPEYDDGRALYATVRLDPPADPAYWDEVLKPGAERDGTPGATVTEGAIGPFIVPDGTRRVTVHLVDAAITTGDAYTSSAGSDRELGDVVVDLAARTPHWRPA